MAAKRTVDFIANRVDLEVLVLGSLGFSGEFIEARTGLNKRQIDYRLKLGRIKRRDYRNGQSPLVSTVIGTLRAESVTTLRQSGLERPPPSKPPRKRKKPTPPKEAPPTLPMIPQGHHDWDSTTQTCKKCGIREDKASSLKWGCSKKKAHAAGTRPRKPRKALAE